MVPVSSQSLSSNSQEKLSDWLLAISPVVSVGHLPGLAQAAVE